MDWKVSTCGKDVSMLSASFALGLISRCGEFLFEDVGKYIGASRVAKVSENRTQLGSLWKRVLHWKHTIVFCRMEIESKWKVSVARRLA